MAVTKSAHRAIEDFVEAIAQHYMEVQADEQQNESVAEEFVSAIEVDLRSTLRDRLSQLETARKAAETPTAEMSVEDFDGDMNEEQPTLVTGDPALLDSGATSVRSGIQSEIDTPTLDTAIGTESNPVVRGGGSSSGDLSYDQNTLDGGDTAGVSSNGKPASTPKDYEIIGVLGRGGMGVVYQARHVPLNRMVAVKMIVSGANASDEQVRRFQTEAEAAAHLKHPNIVSVYEVGIHDSRPYFSLEYVEGCSLSDLMKETTLSPTRAAEILIPVARAVQYSHEMGVLHRDLKPQNILMTTDGQPKVADFGLAKRLDDDNDAEKTREGVVLGTPGYMAPEQARTSVKVGPQADVYALGSILYYLMTGRPPFAAPTPFETVRQLLLSEPVAPSRLQMGLDQDLETICLKTLEKDIEKRYASAGEFADELQRYVDGQPIIARPITRRERLWKWCKRNPRLAAVSGTAAFLLGCLLLGGLISAFVINQQKKAEQIARRDAETNQERAIEQGALAADTTRLLLYKTKDFFDKNPELRKLRQPLMEAVVQGADDIYTSNPKYNVNEVFTASADAQLGQIYLDAGDFQKARDKLVRAEKRLQLLNKDGELFNADVSQMNITLALGDAYRYLGENENAESRYLSLLEQRRDYFDKNRQFDSQQADDSIAEAYGRLANLYRLIGKPDKALDYNLKTVAIRRKSVELKPGNQFVLAELAGALSQLSSSYENAGEMEKMLAASSEALEIQMELSKTQSDLAVRHNTAKDQRVLARQSLLLNQVERARELLEDSTNTLDELVASSDDQRIKNQAIEAHTLYGVVLNRLGEDAESSFRRAETLQRAMIAMSDNVNAQGMLLKILARSGQTKPARELADQMAQSTDKMMNCGYAACGYALMLDHLTDDEDKAEVRKKAVELTRRLIRHGYHDFESMRSTDIDFGPLQDEPEFQAMLDEEEQRVAASKGN